MHTKSIFILLLANCGAILAQVPKICTHNADIIFVLDSSLSIESSGSDDYKKQLNFISGVTQKFDLGPVRFGAVIYSTVPEKLFDLSTYSDHTKLSEAILKARYMGKQTYTGKALDMVKNGMFDQKHGGRVNTTKIVIVLTDGSSNDRVGAANAAGDLRGRGIRIIAIGIGPHAAQGQLSEMASSAEDVFMVTGYNALHHIEEIVAKTACTVPKICTHNADIIFTLDSSLSIESSGPGYYRKQLNFISGVTQKFDLGPVRFGAVIFSNVPEKLFDLGAYSDHTKLSEAILKARYIGMQTYTGKALDMVKNGMFDQNHGGRLNTTKIVIVLTDGQPNDPVEAANAARDMRSRGILIIAIGVGPQAAETQLSEMASSGKDVFTVTDYNVLHYIEETVAKTACTIK